VAEVDAELGEAVQVRLGVGVGGGDGVAGDDAVVGERFEGGAWHGVDVPEVMSWVTYMVSG
jgi:hypothetical protein